MHTPRLVFPRLVFLFVIAAAFTHAGTIVAQSHDAPADQSWQIAAGAGVLTRPDFPGSDSLEVLPLPALNITYGDRWFLNADGLGTFLLKREQGSLSFSVAPDLIRREESDSSHLRGLGDVEPTAVAKLKTSYRLGPVTAIAAIATDIADEGHGTVAELALQMRSAVTQRLAVNYGIAARWIDDEYAESFFGVNTQQSQRSGLAPYQAKSGVGDTRLFINAIYTLSPRWILSTGAAAASLQGDAADSPVVEDDSYFTFDAAVMYRF